MNINELIKALQSAGVTSIEVTEPVTIPVDTPDTDFAVGDNVIVCHRRKDGVTSTHTSAIVTEILQQDEYGWYTRATGANGKHYKAGLKWDEERKGTRFVELDIDEDAVVTGPGLEIGDRVEFLNGGDDLTGEIVGFGHDDDGDYTRILGDNGKYYRAGAGFGITRKGTTILERE